MHMTSSLVNNSRSRPLDGQRKRQTVLRAASKFGVRGESDDFVQQTRTRSQLGAADLPGTQASDCKVPVRHETP